MRPSMEPIRRHQRVSQVQTGPRLVGKPFEGRVHRRRCRGPALTHRVQERGQFKRFRPVGLPAAFLAELDPSAEATDQGAQARRRQALGTVEQSLTDPRAAQGVLQECRVNTQLCGIQHKVQQGVEQEIQLGLLRQIFSAPLCCLGGGRAHHRRRCRRAGTQTVQRLHPTSASGGRGRHRCRRDGSRGVTDIRSVTAISTAWCLALLAIPLTRP